MVTIKRMPKMTVSIFIEEHYKQLIIGIIVIAALILFIFGHSIYQDSKLKNQKDNPQAAYHKPDNFYFKTTQDFVVKNIDDFRNIYFTMLNNGWEQAYFVCNKAYKNCINDFLKTLNDDELMTALNDYVHPFNQYQAITYYHTEKRVKLSVKYMYTKRQIKGIEKVISSWNIRSVEDANWYVANNIVYDANANSLQALVYNHKGNCKAISDFLNVCLYNLGRTSYSISNGIHSWNALIENGKILYIDSTWNKDTNDRYFKIDEEQLKYLDEKEHYIPKIYTYFFTF